MELLRRPSFVVSAIQGSLITGVGASRAQFGDFVAQADGGFDFASEQLPSAAGPNHRAAGAGPPRSQPHLPDELGPSFQGIVNVFCERFRGGQLTGADSSPAWTDSRKLQRGQRVQVEENLRKLSFVCEVAIPSSLSRGPPSAPEHLRLGPGGRCLRRSGGSPPRAPSGAGGTSAS